MPSFRPRDGNTLRTTEPQPSDPRSPSTLPPESPRQSKPPPWRCCWSRSSTYSLPRSQLRTLVFRATAQPHAEQLSAEEVTALLDPASVLKCAGAQGVMASERRAAARLALLGEAEAAGQLIAAAARWGALECSGLSRSATALSVCGCGGERVPPLSIRYGYPPPWIGEQLGLRTAGGCDPTVAVSPRCPHGCVALQSDSRRQHRRLTHTREPMRERMWADDTPEVRLVLPATVSPPDPTTLRAALSDCPATGRGGAAERLDVWRPWDPAQPAEVCVAAAAESALPDIPWGVLSLGSIGD